MSKEIPSTNSHEILDIKTLSPQTKMRLVLEAFNYGKGTSDDKEKRRQAFIDLIGTYNQAIIKSRPVESGSTIVESDINKKRIHDKIMDVIRSMSLSRELKPSIRDLAEYLIHDRKEVERMVTSYFLGYDTAPNPENYSSVRQARENPFYSAPKDNDDD